MGLPIVEPMMTPMLFSEKRSGGRLLLRRASWQASVAYMDIFDMERLYFLGISLASISGTTAATLVLSPPTLDNSGTPATELLKANRALTSVSTPLPKGDTEPIPVMTTLLVCIFSIPFGVYFVQESCHRQGNRTSWHP